MTLAVRPICAIALMGALAVAGCESKDGEGIAGTGIGTKAAIGGLGTAAAGGLIAAAAGAPAAGIAGAVILGGLVGGFIGDRLDQSDRRQAEQNAARALDSAPAGQQTTWQNPDSGAAGTFTPTRTYQDSNGMYCREFRQTIVIDGKTQQGFGTACRQPDGSWKIVS